MRLRLLVLVLMAAVCSHPLVAQQQDARAPEVLRGKITDDSAHAVIGATVMITRGPDRLTQQSLTDSSGRYSIRFAEGTGDYLVYVTAAGFKPVRRRVTRQTTEREFTADFAMERDVALLAAMSVTADKPVRASSAVNPSQLETG